MRRDEHFAFAFKPIDNSRVVREVDPRANRDLWLLLALVAALVGGILLYAWPHLQLRRTGIAAEQASRERDRLVEENRKLRLEKAALENLRRVEAIATRDLGLAVPPADRQVVVEALPALGNDARLAQAKDPSPAPAPGEAN
jgi:cell division protein FtsL